MPKPTTRLDARRAILGAANRERVKHGLVFDPYLARHLQRAVFVCRQRRLVDAEVLELAGFAR